MTWKVLSLIFVLQQNLNKNVAPEIRYLHFGNVF